MYNSALLIKPNFNVFLGHTGQICLFLRNRADYQLPDSEGKSPLDVAVTSEHADIVTLLRLALMDEEMRTGESQTTDDTFQEIVRDIAQRAHDGQESPSTTHTDVNLDEEPRHSAV